MRHRIACSILVVIGAAGLAPTVATAQELPATDPSAAHEFGELAVEPGAPAAVTEGPAAAAEGPQVAVETAGEPLARSTSACPDKEACFWKQIDYGGDRKTADADQANENRYLGAYDRSMKNRFGGRKVLIKDIDFNVVDCIDAGGSDHNLPGAAAIFRIGQVGSSC